MCTLGGAVSSGFVVVASGLGTTALRALVVASVAGRGDSSLHTGLRGRGDVYAGGGAAGRPCRGRHSALARNSRCTFSCECAKCSLHTLALATRLALQVENTAGQAACCETGAARRANFARAAFGPCWGPS